MGAAAAGCAPLPERDYFVPPYAEKGCWARFYEEPGYAGAARQLEGREQVESVGATMLVVPDMDEAGIQPLFSQVSSLRIGPRARLVGYDSPLFDAPVLLLPPGSEVPSTAAFRAGEVDSFRLDCVAIASYR